MKSIKKRVAMILSVAMLISLVGCGAVDSQSVSSAPNSAGKPQEASVAGTTIEITTQLEGKSLEALREVIVSFEKDTGAKVILTEYPKADYESALKTRMAANELPDVLETHGWSRLRYSDYLLPVNNEPWYNNQSDLAKGILEGDGDTAYALMLTSNVLGVFCNKTAADAVGVDVYAIETLDDFTAACKKIIDAGLVPMVNHASAGDLTHVAGIFTTYEDAIASDMKAQLDGTWNWESFMEELKYFSNLIDMGAYWVDRSTMDGTMEIERIATGKSVFYFANSTNYSGACAELNADNEYVVIPFPAAKKGGTRYLAGGESAAYGIWKDTKQMATARAWLEYLSVNGGSIAQNFGGIPAINSITVNKDTYPIRIATAAMERYPDATYVNLWDREYMPSGMWGSFGEAVGMLYADNSQKNLVAIKDFLKNNYDEKYAAAKG